VSDRPASVSQILRNPWVRLIAALAAIVLLLRGLEALREVLTPFVIAFALAYFLNPVVTGLERTLARGGRMHPRTAAVMLIAVLVLLAIVCVVMFVVPAVYHQVSEAIARLPDWVRALRGRLEPLYQRLNLQYPEQTEEMRQRLIAALHDKVPGIVAPVTHAATRAFTSLLGFVLAILHLLVIPVFTLYLLHDMNQIQSGLAELVPPRHRPYAYSRLREMDGRLSAFARGLVTLCLVMGSFYAISFTLLGVPMGLLVGFVMGFFHLIPFMAGAVGLPIVLLLSYVDDQSARRLVVIAVLFAVSNLLEHNVLSPRLVGHRIGLHPVVVILAVLVGGTAFGFFGMLVALPVTAALSVFWGDLRDAYLASAFYRGTP
jgi:predicted PurR-regulated permease PerM